MSKRLKIFAGILFCIIPLLLIINTLTNDFLVYAVNSIVYYQKADVNKVSEKFNMSVTEKSRDGKSYTFYGIEEGTGKEKYVFLNYTDKSYHQVYADEGITKEEAISIASESGYEVNYSDLIIMSSYTSGMSDKGEGVQSHLEWLVYHDGLKGTVSIDFITGKIIDRLR